MSPSAEIVTVCTAALPVLASIGGVIRYLVRILAQVERATELGEQAARAITTHIEQSGAAHQTMTDQLLDHHGRLSAIEATMKGHPA